eukprot:2821245-Pyramimonas_sp.AAC.1
MVAAILVCWRWLESGGGNGCVWVARELVGKASFIPQMGCSVPPGLTPGADWPPAKMLGRKSHAKGRGDQPNCIGSHRTVFSLQEGSLRFIKIHLS